jgi:lipoprotein-releasing system permease protein
MKSTNTKIAFVYLTSRVKQSVVAMLSVVFGVSMYVFMNSFMTGVNDIQTTLAFSTLAHVRVHNETPMEEVSLLSGAKEDIIAHVRNKKNLQFTTGIRHSSETIKVLEGFSNVEAVAPEVNLTVSYRSGATKINGTLAGVDPDMEDAVFDTSHYMVTGRWEDLRHRPDGIIVGKTLAENLGVTMGGDVHVATTEGVTRTFNVVGIIKFAVRSIDGRKAFANINIGRQMGAHNADYVTDLQVRIADFSSAPAVASKLAAFIPYTVEPWQEASGQLEAGSQLRNVIALAVSLAILIVAGFGIYNIMNMTVSEKIREIAILNAMGFDSGDMVIIFLMQSVVIGLFGGIVGTTLGFIISWIVDNSAFPVATLETYPIAYEVSNYVMAFVSGLITTFIAGVLPARKASRVDPVEILRGT